MAGAGLAGCGGGSRETGGVQGGAAALRGFGVDVDQAIAPRVPTLHLKTCGTWGCHEQDVSIMISGPTSALPCPTDAGPDAACGVAQLPGPGPGFGYAPVPQLTFDEVTVAVTTPPGAALPIDTELRVRPRRVCDSDTGRPADGREEAPAEPTCPGATPQAKLRIAADGAVTQAR